jgi:hypothetical protein
VGLRNPESIPCARSRVSSSSLQPFSLSLLIASSTLFDFCVSLTARRAAPVAEDLFLRKQLAFYQEHRIRPRRLTAAARLGLFWSRFCDWKNALVIVKTTNPDGLAPRGVQALLEVELPQRRLPAWMLPPYSWLSRPAHGKKSTSIRSPDLATGFEGCRFSGVGTMPPRPYFPEITSALLNSLRSCWSSIWP